MSNYISVRLSEIERLRREDTTHYMCIPRHEVEWLVTTLREKMAECEELKDERERHKKLLEEYRYELIERLR